MNLLFKQNSLIILIYKSSIYVGCKEEVLIMPKSLDLTGKIFNKLTVIKKADIKKSNRLTWHCRCECGNEIDVITNHLTSGHTKSCGCLQKQKTAEMNPAIDITNQRFGKLVALERAPSRNKHTYWKCQCDCGNICEIRTNALKTNHTMSCGCIASKGEEKISTWLKEHNIIFERQKTFFTCKDDESNYPLKFDFFINNKFLLEYDGITHFQPTGGWNDEFAVQNIQKKDKIKNEWAEQNKIPLYRISNNDIYTDDKLNQILLKLVLEYKEQC